jgi:predicted TIM-barrel fold metal-dependent hydrolase
MSTTDISAIDVHAHYGVCTCKTTRPLTQSFMTGDAQEVVRRAKIANTELSIVSPLLGLWPRGEASAAAGNDEAWEVVSQTPGLLQYVIVNPLQPQTYDQARRMLHQRKCVGIKLHPEEHRYPIKDHGRALFAFAAEHRAVVMVHSGEALSMPEDFALFANEFPQVKLLLAHIGCGHDGDQSHQVRGIQMSRHGNIYADTSSAQSITPGLIEWAVAQVGADRVLFGTDTPLYSTAMQRARIDQADLSDAQKKLILRENAIQLFGLEKFVSQGATATSAAR